MAIGKVGSFGTDAPLREDYIGNALSEVENQGFRYKAEKRLEDEKKKADEDAKLRELSEWNKSVKADVTGYGSVDLPIKEYLMRIKQEGGNLTQKMMNPSLPFNERVKLMGERDAMVSGIDYLKQIPTLLNSTLSEIHEGVKSGKYDADSEDQALKTIKAIEQGDFKIDPSSGNPVVTVWERDEKGNPIKIIADKQNFGDFMKENLTPELKSNYRDIVAKFHKEYIPDRTVIVDSNGREIVDQRVKMNKGSKDYLNAQENAKAILMQPQERKAVAKIAGLKPDDYEGLLDYATTDLLRGVKSEYENKQDPNLALARQKEKREAKKDQEKEIIIGRNSVIEEEGYVYGKKIQKGTKSFPLGNVIIDSGQGKKQKATNIYVSPKGKMYLKTEETGFEGGGSKVTKYTEKGLKRKAEAEKAKKPFIPEFGDVEDVTMSNKKPIVKMLDFGKDANEIGRYALRMGYDSAKELQDDFINRSGGDNFFKKQEQNKQIPTYSKADLKANGWSDAQIQQAVKLGKIKVN